MKVGIELTPTAVRNRAAVQIHTPGGIDADASGRLAGFHQTTVNAAALLALQEVGYEMHKDGTVEAVLYKPCMHFIKLENPEAPCWGWFRL